jgi:hypothetical protein
VIASYTVFEIFNRIEAVIWFVIAVSLPFFVKASTRKKRQSLIAASFGFILFGLTDILEAPTHGEAPGWLWLLKITCAAFLLACRFFYIGWKNFRFTDRYFLFGLFCLTASFAILIASKS